MKATKPPASVPDAIVDEIRGIRAEISARFGNDVGKLCEYLRRKEAEYGDRVVRSPKPAGKRPRSVASGRRG
jgi:hypothetical protein